MDEKTKAKIVKRYNTVICNDYRTPASVLSPNSEPPNTICELNNNAKQFDVIVYTILYTVNTLGVIDDYGFNDMDVIQYTSPQQHYPMHSVSPSISPSQYLKYHREAVFMQANEDIVEDSIF